MTNKEAKHILELYASLIELDLPDDMLILFGQAYELAIKALEERPQGEWVRKEDIIRYIATQYSEHNELVPIWLSIGDLKGGAE